MLIAAARIPSKQLHVAELFPRALVTEMTGRFTLLLPMLEACFAAILVTKLLRSELCAPPGRLIDIAGGSR